MIQFPLIKTSYKSIDVYYTTYSITKMVLNIGSDQNV